MFKLIKELMNLRKSIEEKTKELNRLEKDINNRENIINNIKQNAQNEANIKSEEIINQGRQKLANIEEEISKKGKYINEVQEIKSEYEKISKKVSSQEKKLTKAKSIYNRIQYILEKFEEREITYISKEEFEVNESEYSEYPELNPTVQLKLNSMDLKELRKAFNENEKAIKQTLERYESRYTTKTNATIYKLMVIALKDLKGRQMDYGRFRFSWTISENEECVRQVTKQDFFEWGLTGRDDSNQKRKQVLKQLKLPEHLTTNAMIDAINSFMSYEAFLLEIQRFNQQGE